MNKKLRPLSFVSLGLLVLALLGPFVIAVFGRDESAALGFGATAGVLSLVLAFVSQSEAIGRLVLVIMLAVLIAGLGSIPIIWTVSGHAATRERVEMEREQNRLRQSQFMEEQRERSLSVRPVRRVNHTFPAEELHDESISRIGTTQPPMFQIRLVLDVMVRDCDCDDMAPVHPSGEPGRTEMLHVRHTVLLDERALTAATVVTNLAGGDFNIEISFTKEGSLRFAEITRRNIGKRLALVIGGQLYCAPRVLAEILNGKAVITGRFSQQEAATLAMKITDSIPAK